MSSVERAECYSQSRGAVDILDGTAQRRPFQFVVICIGDAQSTYLLVHSECSFEYMVFRVQSGNRTLSRTGDLHMCVCEMLKMPPVASG